MKASHWLLLATPHLVEIQLQNNHHARGLVLKCSPSTFIWFWIEKNSPQHKLNETCCFLLPCNMKCMVI